MPVWTDQNRCRLLLMILEVNGQKHPPWDEVAARMGAGYTGTAVRQQYQKLRKEGLPSGSGATQPSASNTLKRKRAQPPGKKQPPGRKQPSRADEDDSECASSDESDRDDAKRARLKKERTSSPERTIVKTERVDEEGIVRLDDDDLYC